MSKKREKILPPRKPAPCRQATSQQLENKPGKIPEYYDAFPRECEFAYNPPSYYAIGFRILDVYKAEVDFSEYRNLTFIEDHKQVHKWGNLRKRIPFPEGRITDLPGTRELNYKNYCLRSLTPKSAMSWRKSITPITPLVEELNPEEEIEPSVECICDGEES